MNPSVATSSLAMRTTRLVSSLPMRSTKPNSTLPTRSPRAVMSLRKPRMVGTMDDGGQADGRANDGDRFLAHLVSIDFPF